jgi:hypothetical protein
MMACMNNLIASTLESITLGAPTACDSITMFPLMGPGAVEQEPFYLTLDQALGDGWTEITEVSEQGSVPELRVRNKGAKPVFILDGEELVGAKQNRVVNLTILVPAKATLTIPVSCVEAGRWRARSRVFSAAPRTQHAAGRAKRMAQVSASMQMSGERRSDQAEVWADIADKACRLGAESSTGAMEEIFLRHADFAQRCVDALDPIPGQCGALFLLDGRVAGFDLFDRAITLRRLLPKLVRSVAMDALDRPGPGRPAIKPELLLKVAEHFLAATSGAAVEPAAAVGMGIDLRLVAPKITGAALASDNHVVHVSAFQV